MFLASFTLLLYALIYLPCSTFSCSAAGLGIFMHASPGFLSENRRGARPELINAVPHVHNGGSNGGSK